MGKARGKAFTHKITVDRDDRDRPGQLGDGCGRESARRNDHVRMQGDRSGGQFGKPDGVSASIIVIDDEVAALLVAEVAQAGQQPLQGIAAAARRAEPEKSQMRPCAAASRAAPARAPANATMNARRLIRSPHRRLPGGWQGRTVPPNCAIQSDNTIEEKALCRRWVKMRRSQREQI